MRTFLVFFVLIFGFHTMKSQDLKGKWLATKDGFTYSIPNILILEFGKDEIVYYDFKERLAQHSYAIIGDTLLVNNKNTGVLSFISNDRFSLLTSESKNNMTKVDYVRLQPTLTTFESDDIKKLAFILNENSEASVIAFTDFSHSSNSQKKDGLKDKFVLEKIDDTFMVSIYRKGKREDTLPVREINNDSIILYGLASKPYEIIATSIR